MPNSFFAKSKKTNRAFKKLSKEKQQEVFANRLAREVGSVMNKRIATTFIQAIEWDREYLYDNYVKVIDDPETSQVEKELKTEELLSFIRVEYIKLVAKRAEKEQEEVK